MDTLTITGRLFLREVPPDLDLARFWLSGRMSAREKDRWTVWEGKNILTTAGRNNILTFIGSNAAISNIFAQQFAVGTGPIANVTPSDVALAGELYRAAPSGYAIAGTSVTITTSFGASVANGTYTNAGIFGNGATSTPGSGTLMTHLLVTYTKTSGTAIIADYVLTLA